ncbi:protein kinase domain-containing protein [Microbacterium sp. TWP3-1-2b2]|uniref:serine/threonine-protein kinase n=1 Tax=Microbacterium sp. TWP3-1-2b2 TaxID=2804651 RepID=UPI003CF1B078
MDAIDEPATEMLLDGRYRLGPCLGRGGMAVVYRAEDTILGRTVAIKLLGQADQPSPDTARVRSETTVLASLNHPSLVTLYDARLDPGHAQYLAIEYVDGPTLASRLSHGPMSEAETASLACDLSEALQVVHDAGIIHRDVKPSNVLLAPNSRREAGWTAKLTDFGIAFSLGDPRVTSPGIVVGTAAYMAPEQVRGADLTPAVDIYSLGLVLIEALTGEPAFPVTGKVQTALRRLTDSPVIPDSVDPSWGTLLARMTRADPKERPSARDVAEAAAFLSADVPLQRRSAAPSARPSAVPAMASGVATTGPTQQITAVGPPPAPRRRATRKMRAGALGVMAVVAAAMIAVVGFWTLSPADASSGRVASSTTAEDVFEAPAETTPLNSDPVDTTTTTGTTETTDTPVDDVTEDDVTEDDVPEDDADENPNKGPGNNSGNQKDTDKKENDKKGK